MRTCTQVLSTEGCWAEAGADPQFVGLSLDEIMLLMKTPGYCEPSDLGLADLGPLRHCPLLRELNFSHCHNITSLEPLAACTRLEVSCVHAGTGAAIAAHSLLGNDEMEWTASAREATRTHTLHGSLSGGGAGGTHPSPVPIPALKSLSRQVLDASFIGWTTSELLTPLANCRRLRSLGMSGMLDVHRLYRERVLDAKRTGVSEGSATRLRWPAKPRVVF